MQSFMFSAPVPATLDVLINGGLVVLAALVIAATPLALMLRHAAKRKDRRALPRPRLVVESDQWPHRDLAPSATGTTTSARCAT
jgi:hypothetical protein